MFNTLCNYLQNYVVPCKIRLPISLSLFTNANVISFIYGYSLCDILCSKITILEVNILFFDIFRSLWMCWFWTHSQPAEKHTWRSGVHSLQGNHAQGSEGKVLWYCIRPVSFKVSLISVNVCRQVHWHWHWHWQYYIGGIPDTLLRVLISHKWYVMYILPTVIDKVI